MNEQRFNHRERRFLVPISDKRLTITGGRTYEVVTEYLDTPERTWSALSMDGDYPKIRFRTYDGRDSFLEKKLHSLGHTVKERIPCERPTGLDLIGTIAYRRTEYAIEQARVTIDRDICGEAGRTDALSGFAVVEVKGKMPKTLSWLSKFEQSKFSKWKFVSGALPEQLQDLIYGSRSESNRRSSCSGQARKDTRHGVKPV